MVMPFKQFSSAALASLVLFVPPVYGQSSPPAQAQSIMPLPGVHYRYWPKQLVQWIGPELPYSMIILDVDDRGKQPIYDAELIGKNGQNVVHYTNTAEEEAIDQRAGLTAHQVAMQFDGPADAEKGAQYLLRFNTETGVPVVWQFVLGTDISDQGSGLSQVPASIPILAYRGQGGLADQGTALKVGSITSAADVWKELAHPPFFIPYRGALATGIQILSFVPESVTLHSSTRSLTDSSDAPPSITPDGNPVLLSDTALGTTASYLMVGSSIDRVSFGPLHGRREDSVTIQFSPPLSPDGQSSFEILAGKKTKIAAGAVQATDSNSQSRAIAWTFSAPESLKGKCAVASAGLQR
jgi:hypothetical protein